MPYIYPIILTLIFWLLDAYQDMYILEINFSKAIIFDYPQATPWIRIAIALAILSGMFFFKKRQKNSETKKPEDTEHTIETLYKISDITLSPLPLQKQLNEVANTLQNDISTCKSAFIASFEKDSINIRNNNDFLAYTGIKKTYLPYQEATSKNSLDALLSTAYIEKREWTEAKVLLNGISYKLITHIYFQKRTKKALGLLGMLLTEDDSNDFKHLMEQIANQIAFNIDLENRRHEVIESNNLLNEQLASFDKELNIYNIKKAQEFIEHEIKRSQRYHTQLTLILFNIDHLENLSNIFSKEDILALKKEFIAMFKKNIRDTDFFGKWREEMFVIVAPDIDFRAGKNFVAKLNNLLQKHRFSKVGKITCCYGITSYSPKDSIGEFRKRAENALNKANQRGQNSIETKILV